jgi:hypothetical protein
MVPEIRIGTRRARLVEGFFNRKDGGFGVERVEDGFDEQNVDTAFEQGVDLFAVGVAELIEGDRSEAGIVDVGGNGRRDRHRTERTRDKAGQSRGARDLIGGFPGRRRRRQIDLAGDALKERILNDGIEEFGILATLRVAVE